MIQQVYKFKGRNSLGDVVIGERVAGSRQGLRAILRREQIVFTSVIKESGLAFPLHFVRRRKKAAARVSDDDLARLHMPIWNPSEYGIAPCVQP